MKPVSSLKNHELLAIYRLRAGNQYNFYAPDQNQYDIAVIERELLCRLDRSHFREFGELPHQGSENDLTEEDKKLILECFEVIRLERKASTSMLQRRLRIGYNRAAYALDYLEIVGVLGPPDGSKPREILVDLETFHLTF
jgi:DNA segregation ATPase FtsK/SpoIIIE-like protein